MSLHYDCVSWVVADILLDWPTGSFYSWVGRKPKAFYLRTDESSFTYNRNVNKALQLVLSY